MEIKYIQQQNIDNQNKEGKNITAQFDARQGIFPVPRCCTPTLFSNQKLHFNYDTAVTLLTVFAQIGQAIKFAYFAFNTNIFNSVPTFSDQRLPMSLVPIEWLLAVIDAVYTNRKMRTIL